MTKSLVLYMLLRVVARVCVQYLACDITSQQNPSKHRAGHLRICACPRPCQTDRGHGDVQSFGCSN